MSSSNTTRVEKSFFAKFMISLCLSVLALLLGGAVFVGLSSFREPPAARDVSEKIYNVEVFDVEQSDLQEIISGFGTARSDRDVVVSAQVTGQIVSVNPRLEVGESIHAAAITMDAAGHSHREEGDLLLRIDPDVYQERLTQAVSSLAEDTAELERLAQEEKNLQRMLENARDDLEDYGKEFERIAQLTRDGILQEGDYTRAILERRKYEASVVQYENERDLFPKRRQVILRRIETHRSAKKLAEIDVARTEVRPPFSGAISEVLAELGQNVRPGDPLYRLTDISQIEVVVPLSLPDCTRIAAQVAAGDFPRVELAENETAPQRWVGAVVRVAPEADESTRTIRVFVEVDNQEQETPLLPGTFVHARIDGPILNKAIVVPRDAILEDTIFIAMCQDASDHDRPCQVAAPRRVSVRRTLQTLAIVDPIAMDLQPGEFVILTNLDVLCKDAKVHIQSHRRLVDELDQQRIQIARRLAATEESEGATSAGPTEDRSL